MKTVIRKKVLVVPYTWIPNVEKNNIPELHVIMFQDTDSLDWTLMSGGCKMKENIKDCAKRELLEESNFVINLPDDYDLFSFRTWYRPENILADDKKRGLRVLSHYHVFLFKFYYEDFSLFERQYFQASYQNKETMNICLFPFHEISIQNKKIWDFIRFACLPYLRKYFVNLNRNSISM